MRFRCETHKVEVEIIGNTRRFYGLQWSGTPQCWLFTAKEIKEGKFGECMIVKII